MTRGFFSQRRALTAFRPSPNRSVKRSWKCRQPMSRVHVRRTRDGGGFAGDVARDGRRDLGGALPARYLSLIVGLRPCVDTDCLIGEQEMRGHLASHLGAVHGFAGNLLPAVQGWSLLSTEEQRDWSACVERTLRATAIHHGKFVNWPQSQGKHRPGRTALLVQHCNGAPGIVNALAYFADRSPTTCSSLRVNSHGVLARWPKVAAVPRDRGNGFAFLKLFRRTKDETWLERARRFAMYACRQSNAARQQHHRSRYSLWTGDLGLAIYLWHCINLDDRFPTQDFF